MLCDRWLSLCKKRHQKAACIQWRCWSGQHFPTTSGQPKELLVKHCPEVHQWLWNKPQNIAALCSSCLRCSVPNWGRARVVEQVRGWSRYKDGAGTRTEQVQGWRRYKEVQGWRSYFPSSTATNYQSPGTRCVLAFAKRMPLRF